MARTPSKIEQLKDGIAGAFRAISGDAKCEVCFTEFYETTPGKIKPAPSYRKSDHSLSVPLPVKIEKKTLSQLRGWTDSVALHTKFHDEKLHEKLAASAASPSLLDSLEQVRVEAIGVDTYKGVAKNIDSKYCDWLRQNNYQTDAGARTMPVQDAVSLIAYEYLTARQLPKEAKAARDTWLAPMLAKIKNELNELADNLYDQEKFSAIVDRVVDKLNFGTTAPNEPEQHQKPQTESMSEQEQKSSKSDQAAHANPVAKSVTAERDKDGEAQEQKNLEEHGGDKDEEPSGRRGDSNIVPFPHYHPYAPYTTKFDKIVRPEELASQKELADLRSQLDSRLTLLKDITRKLAIRLQRQLLSQQVRSWKFHTEEGILDAAKLTHIIIDPSYSYPYKYEKETNEVNTVVSILIDNSGSMRGRPITVAALSADILARTLERCGIKVEILGFTTKEWKGGQSRKLWMANGSPENPGRLNDLMHIIYKQADAPYRKARKSLGLMLKEGLLKENIDGEAVLWAHERLLARREKRKILMVISDGAPVDDSTLSTNSAHFMELHLKEVIQSIEKYSDVELLAIGIGHDVTSYYKNAVTLNNVEQLGDAMINKISELFDKPHGNLRRKAFNRSA